RDDRGAGPGDRIRRRTSPRSRRSARRPPPRRSGACGPHAEEAAPAELRRRRRRAAAGQVRGRPPRLQRCGRDVKPGYSTGVNERLRSLPSVDEVLARPAVRALAERVGRPAAKAAVRAAIAEARDLLKHGGVPEGEAVTDDRVLELGASEAAPRL